MKTDYQTSGACSCAIECHHKGGRCPNPLARALDRSLALKAS